MSRIEEARRIFWPKNAGTNIWALVDCARDARLHRAIASAGNFSTCLYAGSLSYALTRAAPYLVRLEFDDDKLTKRLLDGALGTNWGIVLRSDAGLDRLRTHFRRFLVVHDDRRRKLVFRFYDPRVFRVYLPTCTPAELDEIFGPVQTFWADGEDGSELLRFARKGAALQQESLVLKGD